MPVRYTLPFPDPAQVVSDVRHVVAQYDDFTADDVPMIPGGFVFASGTHDGCPLWHDAENRLMLAMESPRPELRDFPETPRFTLHTTEESGLPLEGLISSDDWGMVERAVRLARFVRACGLGFHPDTPGFDYVDRNGARTLSREDARAYEEDTMALSGAADLYDFGFTVWRAAGLSV